MGAAKAAGLVSPGQRDAVFYREAVRVLREEGVQTFVLQRMEECGVSIDMPLIALAEALRADKIEQNYKTGELVNLGPDHKVRADAAEKLLRAALGIGYNHKDDAGKFGKTRVEVVYPTAPLNNEPTIIIEQDME